MRWFAPLVVAAAAMQAAPAAAQPDDALAAARKLFVEAVADENAHRYDIALEKFQRVAQVKETANVRYRIASCLEALGRNAEALAAYDAVVRLGEQDPSSADAVKASREHGAKLEATVARLTVSLPADAPADTELRVDGSPVDRTALAASLPLTPGHHTIHATAPGRSPFDTAVELTAGVRLSLAVTLPLSEGPTAAPVVELPSAPPPSAPPAPPQPPPPGHDSGVGSGPPAGAWVAFGVGGALAVGSVVSFALRASNLSTLDGDCTSVGSGLSCPSSRQNEVSSARDAAAIEGPLGLGLAAGAVVSLGIGAWLWWSRPADTTALVIVPSLEPNAAGLWLRGRVE
jgi:hypothetical protein